MATKSIKYFVVLLLVGLVAIPIAYYGITKKNPLSIFREETVAPPTKPASEPKLTVEIQKGAEEDTLIMRWDNIPNNTARIRIYRAKAGTTQWVLWKVIDLKDIVSGTGGGGGAGGGTEGGIAVSGGLFFGNTDNGSFSISLGKSNDENADYVYYVQALVSSGNNTSTGNGTGTNTGTGETEEETVLWTSPITPTVISTSTPPAATSTPSTETGGTPPPATPSSTQTSSTTITQSTSTPSQPSSSPTSTTQTPPPPIYLGIPYYTPQGTISGYGQPRSGSFWVQHTDNKIDIGWQNFPAGTPSFIVSRSQNQSGPWLQVLAQQNPPTTGGPYSIKILDHTLYDPYYYKMDIYDQDGDITASYGPEYLPPLGQ